MTLEEIIERLRNSSQTVEDAVTNNSLSAILDELSGLKVLTVELRGVGVVGDVVNSTTKKCAYFNESPEGIGITFDKKDFVSWDGSSLLVLLDRKENVSAINKTEGKQLFDAADIFAALGREELVTYTHGHL
ncbi:hypothetical protein [Emticicia sp. C21]|uniref:hypothetical protein n=1 Tax=Emticicia sp. C21 TaxID=2302915 RepID=UPI000E34AE1B|nr:hypothetical protein [Emticicia sp. C21]RFS15357.1 hypothetical protein D0T08_17710 [Emticicia sp. C21]